MKFSPALRLRLDGEALAANWTSMAQLSGTAETGAAVKADAYGLGARAVVPRLWQAGCRDYFVAHWGEAEAIADLVPAARIAVLNGITEADIAPALQLGAIPVLNTPHQIALWKAAGGGRCHVMLDSGMNRLGIGAEQISSTDMASLQIDLLLSHLASADEDVAQNSDQLETFIAMAEGLRPRRKSLANSAGIALGPDYHFDLTRPGLALYGGVASSALTGKVRQTVFPQACVLQTRTIRAGARIGYNATYVAPADMRTATLAIGYADGYLRGFSNSGAVHFQGIPMPVVGRVSMDLLIVDATNCPQLTEGDWVDIDLELSAASTASGVSQYELLTTLGKRAGRRWE